VAAHQISVTGPDGERLYSLEQWLEMDLALRIQEIRRGRVRLMVGDELPPLKAALAAVKEWLGTPPRRSGRK